MHSRDRIAGVDRPLEGIAIDHPGRIAHLRHVEPGGNARRGILTVRRRGEQDMPVVRGHRQHLRGDVFAELLGQLRRIGQQHLRDARNPGCRVGGTASVVANDQDMHLTAAHFGQFNRGGNGAQRRALEGAMIMLGYHKNVCECAHGQITFASLLSFATSAATSGTITPALRLGGSVIFKVFSRGATSTPRSAAFTISNGFFLAFIILGSVA